MEIEGRIGQTIAVVTLASILVGCAPSPYGLATDSDMIAHFTDKADIFLKLGEMLESDEQLATIYRDGSGSDVSDNEISERHAAEYQSVFRELGWQSVFISRTPGERRFTIIPPKNSAIAGYAKGYIYTSQKETPVKSNLDAGVDGGMNEGDTWYREIGPNWYIYLTRHYPD